MAPTLHSAPRRDGRELAARHVLGPSSLTAGTVRRRIRQLDRRFARIFRTSKETRTPRPGGGSGFAGSEWLYENDFVVAEALEALDGALPAEFLRNLPGIAGSPGGRGLPRAEALAYELVRRGRGTIEVGELILFLRGYQEVHPLRLAELWALPSFIRIALLEGLAARAEADTRHAEFGPHILSLRTLAGEDWRGVVEALSIVDTILRADPAEIFAKMDFRTRDRYRGAVERIANRTGQTEGRIAEKVLELARGRSEEAREGHVGYYLIDDGLSTLIASLGRPRPFAGNTLPLTLLPSQRRLLWGSAYFGSIAFLTLLLLLLLYVVVPGAGARLPLLVLALAPAVGTAVGLVNRLMGQFISAPRTLPRLDVRRGIPEAFRTLVAVPVLLGSREEIESIVHNLERNYHANPDPALSFALLTDFPDAPAERTERDGPVLEAVAAGIRRLNRRYGKDGVAPFLLLHRPRRWNPSEGCWMGWERKRGKLSELNQLLLGRPTSMWVAEGDARRLADTPFVLTLDSDTRLPRDSAARLVGTLAHPLNRPEIGRGGRIRRGYSVLQPRIEILPDAGGGTAFSRVYGRVEGLDLYAHAAFDIYQDLFDVGIFAGKGIYDVAAFEASLTGRTPDNTLLSHDLFEGIHGRAGLVADVILLEDFPTHPVAYGLRAHRWIRGDWQLLPWLSSRVPAEGDEQRRNRLSLLSRWMIVDNLRRSLQPPSILGILILGWLWLPGIAWGWTIGLAAVVGLPFLTGSVDAGLRALREFPRRADLEAELRALRRSLARWAMELAFLPFESWNHLDAVVRTLGRLYGSRRRLLEWTTAAVTARSIRRTDSLGFMARRMWMGPGLAVAVATGVALLHGEALLLASAPFLLLWTLSPAIGYRVSRARRRLREPEGEFPVARARSLARRVWGYYQHFQVPEQNWLVPDHYQEDPVGEVATRTSPTNLGMALVGTVTAWDLGFVGTPGFISRLRKSVGGMDRLERVRGHFLNWYDTTTLEPLHPRYISTVDSGNLAASFVVTCEALREAVTRELWTGECPRGVVDTLRVARETLESRNRSGSAKALGVELRALEMWTERNLSDAWGAGIETFVRALEALRDRKLPELHGRFLRIREGDPGEAELTKPPLVDAWLTGLRADVEETLGEILLLLPWLKPRYREDPAASALHRGLLASGSEPLSPRQLRGYLSGRIHAGAQGEGGHRWPEGLADDLESAARAAERIEEDATALVSRLESWFDEMDFRFLYDRHRRLLRIGFSVSTGELDPNHYDLLASEARIASTVAMAKDEAPPAHWLHLGRPFAWTARGPVLLSWAGTMFEYLMPALFLRLPPESVLEEACRRAVRVQRDHGRRAGVPWGVSESGYHILSREGHYQYRAFGVPLLGLSRTPANRLVVAPYASLMAVSFAPSEVFENLAELEELGAVGAWGPYEALDYGPASNPAKIPRVVRSYMAHHQGMILAALGNHLTGHRIVDRYHRNPRIGTIDPYLHERIPWRRSIERGWVDRSVPVRSARGGTSTQTWSPPVRRLPPPVHHLGGPEFVVQLGPDGRGGSRWGDWSIIRGGVGSGMSAGGPDVILLDRDSGLAWSPLPDPEASGDEDQEILFDAHRAEFMRKSRDVRARMSVLVAPGGAVELRQLTIANESGERRRLRLALAMELALAPVEDDLRHPAFQKLFVRAEALPGGEGVLFERRRGGREASPPVVLVSVWGAEGEPATPLGWCTSRESFLGRGRPRSRPAALDEPERLRPVQGAHHPLDPVAAALFELDLDPWSDVSLTLTIAVGTERDRVIELASEYRFPRRREWAEVQARSRAEGELAHIGAAGRELPVWAELLAHILHPKGMERVGVATSAILELTQSTLWRWGISGDHPYILLEGSTGSGAPLLSELLRAQRWWRNRGRPVDLVIVGEEAGEYASALRDRVTGLLSSDDSRPGLGQPGGIHIIRGADVGDEERVRLRTLAAFRVDTAGGPLTDQIATARPEPGPVPAGGVPRGHTGGGREGGPEREALAAGGGGEEVARWTAPSALGGFDPETGDYVITLGAGVTTPAPWSNVVARDGFGFLVTESGGSFTWTEDAGEFRLTPWQNDPVLGLRGEAVYLRDEDSGDVWTPGPGPLGRARTHQIRHGWGRTVLSALEATLEEEVTWSLHPELPVKTVRVRVENRGQTARYLSVTFLADWVLGTSPAHTAGRLQIRFDPERSVVTARNPYHLNHSGKIAFLALDRVPDGMATDRREFLGASGPLDRIPDGLLRDVPGERSSPRGEGCGVLKRNVTLAPGESGEVTCYLGAADSPEGLDALLRKLRTGPRPASAAEAEHRRWSEYLSRVRVETPEPALDALMNGWLPYQVISSRLRGRTGFYQASGAFGFRDQLQDSYTLLPLDPSLAARQLEEAARRQFREGDVLHWWHPGTTRGVRTRCSDDLLWLPWVLTRTVRWTGDGALLEKVIPFLEGESLSGTADERYDEFSPGEEEASLWEHGLRAVERAAERLSPRGLPLIGSGDWNDGMDRVGAEGRGESVWLGWFFLDVCRQLIPLARERGEDRTVLRLEDWSATVREAIETHGWDGEWYRRAFFDSGEPLGARDSPEARIDSIAQSWSVISGAADPVRARVAMDSAWRELVRTREGMALLLTPPFTGRGPDPGYIAAYPPGVRENGGQYTHASAWLIRALARIGDGERAGALLRAILPVRHAEGEEGTARYRSEPYVMAADIYGAEPHVGRGGWSWYTGSAGWVWRVALQDVLGVRREGPVLSIEPCIPSGWEGYRVEIEVDDVRAHIEVRNPDGVARGVRSCLADGLAVDSRRIPIPRADAGAGASAGGKTGRVVRIEVTMGGGN